MSLSEIKVWEESKIPRTTREYCLSFILVGIIALTAFGLVPFFGPQPLSNPIAVGILITVVIVSCILLSLNRVIYAKLQIMKDNNIMCPNCYNVVKSRVYMCSRCGFEFRQSILSCPNCNNPITQGVKFCTNCGNQLN